MKPDNKTTLKVAYIALGTNLGERLANLKQALEILSALDGLSIKAVSAVYETAPIGGPAQGPYLNACAVVDTALSPVQLLAEMLAIEERMGRVRNEHWGPRIIDLDLLIYEGVSMNTPVLELPHPRMAERDFVLIPLADIAPGLVVPGPGKTVSEILASRQPPEDIRLFLNNNWF